MVANQNPQEEARMFYAGIDLHRKYLVVAMLDNDGARRSATGRVSIRTPGY
jgi:hypothetical protein